MKIWQAVGEKQQEKESYGKNQGYREKEKKGQVNQGLAKTHQVLNFFLQSWILLRWAVIFLTKKEGEKENEGSLVRSSCYW